MRKSKRMFHKFWERELMKLSYKYPFLEEQRLAKLVKTQHRASVHISLAIRHTFLLVLVYVKV